MQTTIRDLAKLVGGRVILGSMPPLDGELQTLGRIVPHCQQVRQGDVVLWLGTECGGTTAKTDCFLEEAFVRGALGVIAERPVAPWPGRFCIQVPDAQKTLSQVSDHFARSTNGKRVLIIDRQVPSPAYHILCQATDQELAPLDLAAASDCVTSMRWQVIGLDTSHTHTLIHTVELPSSDWQTWFRPDLVVFCCDSHDSPPTHQIEAWASLLNRHVSWTNVVCPDSWQDSFGMLDELSERTTYGETAGADIHGQMNGCDSVTIDGCKTKLPTSWRSGPGVGFLGSILSSVAVARKIGLDEQRFIREWIEQGEQQRRQLS